MGGGAAASGSSSGMGMNGVISGGPQKKVSDALRHAPKKPKKKELGKAVGDWISKAKRK